MITGRQIRAARGLLKWRVEDLALACTLTREAITRIESEVVQPREATVTKIMRAFQAHNVAFLGNQGVTIKDDLVTTWSGDHVYLRLLDDVFYTLYQTPSPEAWFFFADHARLTEAGIAGHRRLAEAGIACRYLCHERPKKLAFEPHQYRAMPDAYFHTGEAVLYGDKFASLIVDPKTQTDQSVIILRSPPIVAAQRQLFRLAWDAGQAIAA